MEVLGGEVDFRVMDGFEVVLVCFGTRECEGFRGWQER